MTKLPSPPPFAPALPLAKEQGSPADVGHHHCQAERDGDSDVVDAHRDLLGRSRLYFCAHVSCPNVSFPEDLFLDTAQIPVKLKIKILFPKRQLVLQ